MKLLFCGVISLCYLGTLYGQDAKNIPVKRRVSTKENFGPKKTGDNLLKRNKKFIDSLRNECGCAVNYIFLPPNKTDKRRYILRLVTSDKDTGQTQLKLKSMALAFAVSKRILKTDVNNFDWLFIQLLSTDEEQVKYNLPFFIVKNQPRED